MVHSCFTSCPIYSNFRLFNTDSCYFYIRSLLDPKYYDTMLYKLTQNEIIWRRGVWFKNTGIVPYNRITNIDIVQGPISRSLRIASIKIQTAGYSGPSGSGGMLAEIRIEGMEEFEDLRELIMGFVRGKKPMAVEANEEDINLKILDELVKIRELMEKSS